MSKLYLSMIMMIALFIPIANAQVNFLPPPKPQTVGSSKNAMSIQITPPLSPDEFKSKAAAASQKNQSQLFKNAQSFLKQQEGQAPIPTSTSTTLPNPQTTSPMNTAPETPSENIPTSTNPVTTTTTTTNPPGSLYAPTPSTSSTTAPSQNQTYTGFGTPSNNGSSSTTTAPSSNSQQSGGWNIKY